MTCAHLAQFDVVVQVIYNLLHFTHVAQFDVVVQVIYNLLHFFASCYTFLLDNSTEVCYNRLGRLADFVTLTQVRALQHAQLWNF